MSIISNVEKYMKRYDYLIEKQQRKCREGKTLSKEEHEELRKLRPNVFTPILMMFELLHDTVKSNQVHRQQTSKVKSVINQTGGTPSTTMNVEEQSHNDVGDIQNSTASSETKRLSELEKSLLPLLTKIIMYIELKKNKKGKSDSDVDGEEEEDEKYPDIGTSAKNSAILVVRRIKKWWNDLVAGGTSDISSKINLKKAIPQLPNNPEDMNNLHKMSESAINEMVDKATDAIHNPLKKIEKILSNDVRDIASSSVEGIMNALSLIPGIGTTLQLWRLLQNVIVIMSKSVSTMADTKTVGGDLKKNVLGLKAEFESMANPEAIAAAATKELTSHIPRDGSAGVGSAAANLSGMAQQALGGGVGSAAANLSGMAQQALTKQQGGANDRPHKTNHIRSIKKYKREYKHSLREIQKTRKNILSLIKNMI